MAETLDLSSLSVTIGADWRIQLARSLNDALSKKLQHMPGTIAQDQLAVLFTALTDCCSVVCATSLEGYEASAFTLTQIFRERLDALRPLAGNNVARATAGNPTAKE